MGDPVCAFPRSLHHYCLLKVIRVLLALALFSACVVSAGEPDQRARWQTAKLSPKWTREADAWIFQWLKNRAIYERLEKARTNGVPAQFIFGFHVRESDASFTHHLHEGSPLRFRTRYVPIGRPKVWNPPTDWFSSALDALYDYERLHTRWNWSDAQSALQGAESYNGLGYQRKGRVTPYLWSGTTIYRGGKYVRDGVFSATTYDQQIGICAILLRMQERGIPIPGVLEKSVPAPLRPAALPEKPVVKPVGFGDLLRDVWKWITS